MRILRFLLIPFAFISLPALSDIQLTFGVYTSDKATAMVKQFRPVLNALEAKMTTKLGESVHIRMQISKSYQQGLANLVEGKVDFARFGPSSYILAKQSNPEIKILAIENNKGGKTFNGVICVHKNSSIQSAKELTGKSFAFGDENSTIGRYLSQSYLADHSITAQELDSFEYLGRHDKVGAAVASEQYDAGALKESTFKKLIRNGAPLRVIASFENITKPWIASSSLAPDVVTSLTTSLIELEDPKALKAIKKDGFLPGTDSDYEKVRVAMADKRFFSE
ncbi:PhnD/SsuA/transferrin family substrate-binding protein [Photobacterium sp. SDRW27]|uniref:PhnD/SsuA/transferrin family substrate-binding protein n=1 Tax=Photobacterium obscurum TaxID=2829490 RepID=UPI00224477E5|nr:PhnD/SsuA/transferrin family substrate-binding protein [Photobacterium obscurum]MCW8327428.1 PhnD/SsuA/transferrin family substrate-binding protein [Photobacterium obscurum]